VLVSANALSRWAIDAQGFRLWTGFDGRALRLVHDHPVALDSAGFVAAHRYRGFPWDTEAYLDLAASAPWIWWASQDWCVEPEIARDEDAVLDRISGTVRLNIQHAALHPRVASCDSQAYGVAARHDAWKARVSTSDRYVAGVMRRWYDEQMAVMHAPPTAVICDDAPVSDGAAPMSSFDERLAETYEELRALHEAGDIAWSDVSPIRAYEMAFLDD
jgi:hypothetical protein